MGRRRITRNLAEEARRIAEEQAAEAAAKTAPPRAVIRLGEPSGITDNTTCPACGRLNGLEYSSGFAQAIIYKCIECGHEETYIN